MSDGAYNEAVCPVCRGNGSYHESNGSGVIKTQCTMCGGSGHISTKMDQSQGCNHSFPSDHVWTTGAGYPRSVVQPQKTWLDDCAFQAMCGILSDMKNFDFSDCKGLTFKEGVAKHAYAVAQAMLAEKQRIEKEEAK